MIRSGPETVTEPAFAAANVQAVSAHYPEAVCEALLHPRALIFEVALVPSPVGRSSFHAAPPTLEPK